MFLILSIKVINACFKLTYKLLRNFFFDKKRRKTNTNNLQQRIRWESLKRNINF